MQKHKRDGRRANEQKRLLQEPLRILKDVEEHYVGREFDEDGV